MNQDIQHPDIYNVFDHPSDLVKHAPDAIIVIDSESRIRLWNPKSEQIFGWKQEEVIDKLLGDVIIPPQYRELHYKGMKRYLSTGEIHVLHKTIEITALKKSGKEFFIALTISNSTHKGETIFIAFIRDISEHKKMEQELKLQKQQLENNNAELAQYASLASHDLKEPVRKMLTFSDLLLNMSINGAKNITPEEVAKRIHNAAQRLKELIDGISKFAGISQTLSANNATDMHDAINIVRNIHRDDIDQAKATFFVSNLPPVSVAREHLLELFDNLISNSLKYSKPDETLVIEISAKVSSNHFAEITFTDNGLGFDDRYAQKVFQPFQRLHGPTYEGTGIGLAICKKIIEGYGGNIKVQSTPHKGASFIFSLPILS